MEILLVNTRDELLNHGRVCAVGLQNTTKSSKVVKLYKDMDNEKAAFLRSKVWGTTHTSVFEDLHFTFMLEDVSMLVELFLISHRIASFNIKSRRYVNFADQGYYIPKITFDKPKTEQKTREIEAYIRKTIDERFADYVRLVEDGEATEDARYILPLNLHSNISMNVNSVELLRMMHNAAILNIPELNDIMENMRSQVAEVFPEMFNTLPKSQYHESYKDIRDSVIAMLDAGVQPVGYTKEPIPRTYQTIRHADTINHISDTSEDDVLRSFINDEKLMAIMFSMDFRKSVAAVNDVMSDLRDINHKINELYNMSTGSVGYEDMRLSFSALTHIMRHRMQTLIIPDLVLMGLSKSDNYMSDKPKYKNIIDRHHAFLETLKLEGVSMECLSYFKLCGDLVDVAQTSNLREATHIANLRLCNRAQAEIKNVVTSTFNNAISDESGLTFDEFNKHCLGGILNPTCVSHGYCKEGKMSCGRLKSK